MRLIGVILIVTLLVIGCGGKGVKGWPPGEFKDADEAYPELPPVSVPGLTGLEDSPSLGYDLSQVMYLPQSWGSTAERRFLSEHGFVVTDETRRQICSFYIETEYPTFITTDSLLYAYHVNVEECLYQMEVRQVDALATLLKDVRGRLKTERAKYELSLGAGKRNRAARELDAYLSVAEMLTEVDSKEAIPSTPTYEQQKEIELILAAKGPAVSPLRGVPVDYSRFEPRGLYVKDKRLPEERGYNFDREKREQMEKDVKDRTRKLKNYYRAVTWLSEIPFRISDENETMQALILASVDLSIGPDDSPIAAFNAPYVEFLGPSDDPGIGVYRRVFSEYFGSMAKLGWDETSWKSAVNALKQLPRPRVTTIPDAEAVKDPGLYAGLRFMPRPALHENEIFNALGPFGMERIPPSGEEFLAVMGSPAAQEIVKGREARRVPGYDELYSAAVVAEKEAEKTYATEICRKRRALYRSLIETPEDPELPRYYRHSAWRYKDLNTCLAGWAHYRYVWDLHGKKSGLVLGISDHFPNAVVEPNPAFFGALRDLSRATGRLFSENGIAENRFIEIAEVANVLAVIASRRLAGDTLSDDGKRFLNGYGELLANLCGFLDNSWLVDDNLPDTSFCVPVSVDLYTGNERVVGQGRPRAIYVICEQDGETFLAEGGVLSYRDWLGPAWGPEKMDDSKWLQSLDKGEIPALAWQGKFYASD